MKKYLSTLVCGFGAGVISVVPIAKNLSCCLVIPAAAILSIFLDRKSKNIPVTEKIDISKAVLFGLFTGLFAALFGSIFEIVITFITKSCDLVTEISGVHQMIAAMPLSEALKQEMINLFELIIEDIKNSGFSLLYTLSVIFNSLFVNTIFGIIGGLIGAQVINKQAENKRDINS